ncbi:hypothetical protein DMB66_54995 [Actinoplanes sp. ATCC 53533]|uniref:hypothetical protein n=1 Tax=Actinoplanes sp. ATCC 53533 TaxID=1288362 RepID=UPI000F7AC1F2|nr:hypothetical protein [Actinoplanes sp. ATCC 53533]RSM42206.1 hypothetical protein DMB66_54995 [Actinoplanes sp. ATCC 53533]
MGWPPTARRLAVLTGAGIRLAAIDLHVQRLPRKIVATAAAVRGLLIIAAAQVSDRLGLAATAGSAALVPVLAYLATALLIPGQLGVAMPAWQPCAACNWERTAGARSYSARP